MEIVNTTYRGTDRVPSRHQDVGDINTGGRVCCVSCVVGRWWESLLLRPVRPFWNKGEGGGAIVVVVVPVRRTNQLEKKGLPPSPTPPRVRVRLTMRPMEECVESLLLLLRPVRTIWNHFSVVVVAAVVLVVAIARSLRLHHYIRTTKRRIRIVLIGNRCGGSRTKAVVCCGVSLSSSTSTP